VRVAGGCKERGPTKGDMQMVTKKPCPSPPSDPPARTSRSGGALQRYHPACRMKSGVHSSSCGFLSLPKQRSARQKERETLLLGQERGQRTSENSLTRPRSLTCGPAAGRGSCPCSTSTSLQQSLSSVSSPAISGAQQESVTMQHMKTWFSDQIDLDPSLAGTSSALGRGALQPAGPASGERISEG
jgi:hypothetical protein